MKLAVLAMLPLLAGMPVNGLAQTPPPTTQKPPETTPAPAPTQKPPAPAPRRTATPTAAPTAITISVTDQSGAPIPDVRVALTGSIDRSGSTQSDGTIKFDGLRPGTYRLRFVKDGFTQFEREVELRAGQPAPSPSVSLSPAPPTPAPPPPPKVEAPPKPAPAPPPGKAMTLAVPDFIERNFIGGSQPQKVSPVGCSGVANTQLWQIREAWTDRQHGQSDALLYVVGGEGALRLDGRDNTLQAGTFASVPRGSTYSLTRRGRNPLIVLATLVGEPCPQ